LTIRKGLNIVITGALKGKGMSSKKEKEEWAEKHARRIQEKFEQWQKPLGIDCEEYLKYLRKELVGICEHPLKKSLIEMIS
jgi:hypothetical protein